MNEFYNYRISSKCYLSQAKESLCEHRTLLHTNQSLTKSLIIRVLLQHFIEQ